MGIPALSPFKAAAHDRFTEGRLSADLPDAIVGAGGCLPFGAVGQDFAEEFSASPDQLGDQQAHVPVVGRARRRGIYPDR